MVQLLKRLRVDMHKNSTYTMMKVLTQKVDDGFKQLGREIGEIKEHVSRIQGCIQDSEKAILKNELKINNHIERSKEKKKSRFNFSLFRGG